MSPGFCFCLFPVPVAERFSALSSVFSVLPDSPSRCSRVPFPTVLVSGAQCRACVWRVLRTRMDRVVPSWVTVGASDGLVRAFQSPVTHAASGLAADGGGEAVRSRAEVRLGFSVSG